MAESERRPYVGLQDFTPTQLLSHLVNYFQRCEEIKGVENTVVYEMRGNEEQSLNTCSYYVRGSFNSGGIKHFKWVPTCPGNPGKSWKSRGFAQPVVSKSGMISQHFRD